MREPSDPISDEIAGFGAGDLVKGQSEERRASILDCAERIFLDKGFHATSMSRIAAQIGGSKGTLYNYFSSKQELFIACVQRECERVQRTMSSLTTNGFELDETLALFGQRYVRFVASDDIVRKFRMVVSEAEREPEMARSFYETGPIRAVELLADYLRGEMRAGRVIEGDATRAAQQFLSLCNNHLSKGRLCNYYPEPTEAEIERDVMEGVRIFLASYGARC